jgi:hypothetical protein
MRLR